MLVLVFLDLFYRVPNVHARVPGAFRRLAQPAGTRRTHGRVSMASAAISRARGEQHPKQKLIFFLYNEFGLQYNNIFIVQQLLEYFDKTTMPTDTAL